MATYKFDPASGVYVPVDDSQVMADPTLAAISVSTDLADYAPGSTAYFSANVGVGETVTFEVTDVAGNPVSGTNAPWTITDGGAGDLDGIANGVIQTSWAVGQDAAYEAFVLSATDPAAGWMVTTDFTDKPFVPSPAPSTSNLDMTAPGSSGNVGDAFFQTLGIKGSGTGDVTSFLRVQNSPTEAGFNTDGSPLPPDDKAGNWTHSLKLADVPTVTLTPGGAVYREFILDIAQSGGNNAWLSLDGLQIFQETAAAGGSLTNFTPGAGFGQPGEVFVYNLDAGGDHWIALKDLSNGNGQTDYRVLIPDADFTNKDPNSYIYLYTQFGNQSSDYVANSSFEEWAVRTPSGGGGPTPHASISVLKDTVCPDDITHSVANGTLLTGSAVEWIYKVTNTSDAGVNLTNIVVTDDGGNGVFGDAGDPTVTAIESGGFNVGDVNHDHLLNPGEVWQYSATGTVVEGQYQNFAHVTTAAVDQTVENPNPTGDDTSTYTGVTVASDSVQIVKYVSVDGKADGDPTKTWLDANDAATAPLLLGSSGVNPEYKFTITNKSDVQLTIHLSDAELGVSQDVTLNGNGGTTDVFATGTWGKDLQTNTADVSASFTDACGNTATPTDSDVANYFGAAPSLDIDKYIVCSDGDFGPWGKGSDTTVPNLLSGDVNYVIAVTNTGNVTLDNLNVNDLSGLVLTLSQSLSTGAGDGSFDKGDVWVYTAVGSWQAGIQTNTAEATASFIDDGGHSADPASLDVKDSVSYYGVTAGVTLDKQVTGDHNGATWFNQGNGNASDAPVILVSGSDGSGSHATGAQVYYKAIVTNTTDAAIDYVVTSVTDDNPSFSGGAGDHIAGNGGTATYDFGHITAVVGSNTDTAGVSGNVGPDDCGDSTPAGASDTAQYVGATASLSIDKQVWNGTAWKDIGTTTGQGPIVLAGYNVSFQALVSESSVTGLTWSNTQVTDSPAATITPPGSAYTFSLVAQSGGLHTDTATVTADVSDSFGNKLSLSASDTAEYFGATAGINLEKVVSVDGGANWYTVSDANDNHTLDASGHDTTLAAIASGLGVSYSNVHYGTPVTMAGAQVKFDVIVTNTGTLLNETFHGSDITDNTGLTFGSASTLYTLAPNQSIVLAANSIVTAGTTTVTNTAGVTGTVTDNLGDTVHPTDSDQAAFTGIALSHGGLTQGFWSQHKELYQDVQNQTWMNITQNGVYGDSAHPNTNTGAQIFGNDFSAFDVFAHGGSGKKGAYTTDSNDDIIYALSHNGGTGTDPHGVLLGDANGDGSVDFGETIQSTMLMTSSAAYTALNTSSGGNSKTIMLNQLIAAQLNIYNGDHDPGSYNLSSLSGHDLVEEAVLWLNNLLPNETGANKNTNLTSDGAWNNHFFDTGVKGADNHEIFVSGQDIKNALQYFNQGNLVTSADDTLVGWTTNGGVTVVGVHANTPDNFWAVLYDQHVITG